VHEVFSHHRRALAGSIPVKEAELKAKERERSGKVGKERTQRSIFLSAGAVLSGPTMPGTKEIDSFEAMPRSEVSRLRYAGCGNRMVGLQWCSAGTVWDETTMEADGMVMRPRSVVQKPEFVVAVC
jgi:hypothetical protein